MYVIANWIHLQVREYITALVFLTVWGKTASHTAMRAFIVDEPSAWIEIWSYLLLGNSHVILHVRENCGFNEEPFQAQSFASTLQLGSFLDSTLDIF